MRFVSLKEEKMRKSGGQMMAVRTVNGSAGHQFSAVMGLMAILASLIQCSEAKTVEMEVSSEDSSDLWFVVLMLSAVLIIVDAFLRCGRKGLQQWMNHNTELRVKLLQGDAILPSRSTEGSAGLDLFSVQEVRIPPEAKR